MAFIGKKPTDAPLTSSDVADGIITNAKLAQDIISGDTALAVAPADTDEFLVSDAGTLKRIDYSLIKAANSDAFLAIKTSNQSISDSTTTALTYDTERYDTGSNFASNAYTVPSDGYYYLYTKLTINGTPSAGRFGCSIMQGSTTLADCQNGSGGAAYNTMGVSVIVNLSASDVIDIDCRQTTGSTQEVYGASWNSTYFGGFKLNI